MNWFPNLRELNNVLNLISENPFISKLDVTSKYIDVTRSELNQLVTAYPLIVELHLRCYLFTADDAVAFVHQLKKLKKIRFRVKDRSECDHFLEQLNKKWQHSIESSRDEDEKWKIYFYITSNC